jgi:NADH dehydrogenase (ubiquinone) Fe-S protein 3
MNLYYQFLNYCIKIVPRFIILASVEKSEISILSQHDTVYFLILFFKKHTNTLLNVLSDITAVDYPQKSLRFEVVYNCFSIKYNYRLRFKVSVSEILAIPSIHNIFLCSNWFEREVFDLFGVFFYNHARLRRILTDYGFVGYPLRKDFPTTGFYEVRYSENLQKVIYEPLELSSAMRFV